MKSHIQNCGRWRFGVANLSIPLKRFFCAHGINTTDGLTDVRLEEAGLKRSMAATCR